MKKFLMCIREFLVKYFIISQLILFGTFSLFFVYDFRGNYAPHFLHFWNKDVFRQVWTMFTPDPPTTNLYLFYRCHHDMPLTEFDFSPNFFEQQTGRGRYMQMFRELTSLITAKRKRKENNIFREVDGPVLEEGINKMRIGLKAECRKRNQRIGEITYEFKSVEITEL